LRCSFHGRRDYRVPAALQKEARTFAKERSIGFPVEKEKLAALSTGHASFSFFMTRMFVFKLQGNAYDFGNDYHCKDSKS
jgi:hypothetical protein